MLGEFFPGELRDDEKVKRAALKNAQADLKKEKKKEEEAEECTYEKGVVNGSLAYTNHKVQFQALEKLLARCSSDKHSRHLARGVMRD